MPTRWWLHQGSAYHFAETAPDFSIKKLFNVVTSGTFVAYQFIELIFQGFHSLRCTSRGIWHHFGAPRSVKSFMLHSVPAT
jgi:hypothetical protein